MKVCSVKVGAWLTRLEVNPSPASSVHASLRLFMLPPIELRVSALSCAIPATLAVCDDSATRLEVCPRVVPSTPGSISHHSNSTPPTDHDLQKSSHTRRHTTSHPRSCPGPRYRYRNSDTAQRVRSTTRISIHSFISGRNRETNHMCSLL